ncbi:MAG: GNAT family N-acetyltransferase [Candidatus Heimdallarchaeaceae archaeon]
MPLKQLNLYLLPKNRKLVKKAAMVNARAFVDDPLFRHFFPRKKNREKKIAYLFYVTINYGIRYGEVYATSDRLEGVAVWLPPHAVHSRIWGAIISGGLLAPLKSGWLKPMFTYNFISKRHKRLASFPHWYLSSIAIDPLYQGKGYASKLIRPMFERIDEEGLPCYLETQNEQNIPIYEHYGFELIESLPIPKTSIWNHAMIRR